MDKKVQEKTNEDPAQPQEQKQPVMVFQPVVQQPTKPQNGLAIASMITGIVSLFLIGFTFFSLALGIVALILGIMGLKKPTGKGMAIAGIATGGLTILIFIIILVVAVMISSMYQPSIYQTMMLR